ncbi:DUF724 domain-containing protein 3-like [Neltuma alba]|uniref:DUF724 domain-containing protein 3-like n=1 Tax=Neltuma alba TaxID=207710 RepID=UPI0010A4CB2B|nr:DUF724 domain-containing protein 3-like [Prosopis alba]XP_028807661.1 DUF724 domain-containing protein 3-like [Prosopis alba]
MRPPIKKTSYGRGQGVEVSVKEEGFHGSYFEAKVVSYLDNGLYIVQYQTLLEDDESKFLTETVYPKELRPLPPAIPVRRFSVKQKVDVFDKDGWWVGVITRKDGPDGYFVYFWTTDEEIAYPSSLLRVHQDWINGKWVLPKKARS